MKCITPNSSKGEGGNSNNPTDDKILLFYYKIKKRSYKESMELVGSSKLMVDQTFLKQISNATIAIKSGT